MIYQASISAAVALSLAAGTALAGMTMQVFENASGIDHSGLVLTVDVIDQGSHVDFRFNNSSSISSVVTTIYFESNAASSSLLANGVVHAGNGPVFSPGASPGQPAGSIQHHGGAWLGELAEFGADAPPPHNGINPGEYLTIRFDLLGTFADVAAAAASPFDDGFRIAQHVQSVGPNEASLWTVTTPTPGAIAILGAGALVAARRRRGG